MRAVERTLLLTDLVDSTATFSPDGTRAVLFGHSAGVVLVDGDGTHLADADTTGAKSGFITAVWSPDSQPFAVPVAGAPLRIYRRDGEVRTELDRRTEGEIVSLSRDHIAIASRLEPGGLVVYDLDGRLVAQAPGHIERGDELAWSDDGTALVTGWGYGARTHPRLPPRLDDGLLVVAGRRARGGGGRKRHPRDLVAVGHAGARHAAGLRADRGVPSEPRPGRPVEPGQRPARHLEVRPGGRPPARPRRPPGGRGARPRDHGPAVRDAGGDLGARHRPAARGVALLRGPLRPRRRPADEPAHGPLARLRAGVEPLGRPPWSARLGRGGPAARRRVTGFGEGSLRLWPLTDDALLAEASRLVR